MKKYFILVVLLLLGLSFEADSQKRKAKMTDRNPIIGVSASSSSGVNKSYINSVRKAGGVPVIIPITSDECQMDALLEALDGIVMTGGEDVDPKRYGEEPLPELGKVFHERDDFDIKLIRKAVDKGLPLFAICRGVQVLNVAFGGTLYQDIPSQLPDNQINHRVGATKIAHKIDIPERTLLHGILGDSFDVNSSHHQAVKDLAPGFRISAVAEDGIVEAIEMKKAQFVVGVQFHPESFVSSGDDSFLPLFEAFVNAASRCRR